MREFFYRPSRGQWPHFSPLICECVAHNYTPVMITVVIQCTGRTNTQTQSHLCILAQMLSQGPLRTRTYLSVH